MVDESLTDAKERMKGAISALEDDLATLRTGRASPALVEKLPVEYYGMDTPLLQLASISVPEPRQLLIKPFDRSTTKDIERAILKSDLGLNPNNDGKNIWLNLPQLTEERRIQLARVMRDRLEEARVAVRNVRRDIIRDLRDFENEKMITEDDLKWGEDEVQKLTDQFVEKIKEVGDRKEAEIMEI